MSAPLKANLYPLPPLSDQDIKNVRAIIDKQFFYKSMFDGGIKILEPYEKIDTINQTCSFDTSEIESPSKKLGDLYIPQEFKEFYKDINPKEFLIKTRKLIAKDEALKKQLQAYIEIKEFDSATHTRESVNTLLGMTYTLMENKTKLDAEADIISPFNSDAKIIRELIKHTALIQHKLEEPELLAEIFLLPIREKYANALQSHFIHALLDPLLAQTLYEKQLKDAKSDIQPKYPNTTQATNAQALLDDPEFAEYVVQGDVSFEMSNFNTIFFEKKQELRDTLAEYIAKIRAVNGYNANFATITQADPTKTHSRSARTDDALDIDLTKQAQQAETAQWRKLRENKDFYNSLKNYRKTSKLISFMILGASVGSGAIRWSELTSAQKYSLGVDSAKLLNEIGAAAYKYKEVKEIVKKLALQDVIKGISEQKILAKAGVIGVVIATAYEVESLDKDDLDGKAATALKGVLTVGLLLAPVGGMYVAMMLIALEIAWFFFSDMFIDTPIEAYLYRSLLYNLKENDPEAIQLKPKNDHPYHYETQKVEIRFLAKLLHETAQIQEVGNFPSGFRNAVELRDLIGDNYDTVQTLFDDAMEYELQTIQTVLYGHQISIKDNTIIIPKEILQNNISVNFKIAGERQFIQSRIDSDGYETIYAGYPVAKGDTPVMPEDFKYNPFTGGDLKLLKGKSSHLLIINRDIILKYNIEFHYSYDVTDNGMGYDYDERVELGQPELMPLTSKEHEMIQYHNQVDMKNTDKLTQEKQQDN